MNTFILYLTGSWWYSAELEAKATNLIMMFSLMPAKLVKVTF